MQKERSYLATQLVQSPQFWREVEVVFQGKEGGALACELLSARACAVGEAGEGDCCEEDHWGSR